MNIQEIYQLISGGDKMIIELSSKLAVNSFRANIGRVKASTEKQLRALLEDGEVPVTSLSLRSVSISGTKIFPQKFEVSLIERREKLDFKVVEIISTEEAGEAGEAGENE